VSEPRSLRQVEPCQKQPKSDWSLPRARVAVGVRSKGRCEAKFAGCSGWATQVHHVARRSQGGTHDPENLKHVCDACHLYIHLHVGAAKELGLLA
jgi:hypothetical protein